MNSIKKNLNLIYVTILIFFSFFINFYYSKIGAYPIDTFLHYDSAYRIINGEHPVKDYWIASGFLVDYIQSIFFKLFDVNWNSFIIHSSLFNSILTILLYYFLIKKKINKSKVFIYCVSFAILGYTISGTPFVDQHATFFFLISSLLIIYNLELQKNYIWILIIFLFFFSFLSKQVPAAYGAIIYTFLLSFYFFYSKKLNQIRIIFFSIFAAITILFIFLLIVKISITDFILQYLLYPRTIGENRFENFNITFNSIFNQFKFIFVPLIIYCFLYYKNFKKKKTEFYYTKILPPLFVISLTFILLFHQIMTKNQIFIYFLIPILIGFIEIELGIINIKHKSFISVIMIIFLIIVTTKYHLRYNDARKFHELERTKLSIAVDARKIDNSLIGLKWVNPHFDNSPLEEIKILLKAKNILNTNNNQNIMLITHYSFFDSITSVKLNSPSRAYDQVSLPLINNKHSKLFKKFLITKIKKKNISSIYFFRHEKFPKKNITSYFKKKCLNNFKNEIFLIYKIKCLE